MNAEEFERAVELATGETVDNLRKTPVDERRRQIEKQRGRLTHFVSYFPIIGRGNILRDRMVSHDQAEKALEEALRDG